MNALRLLVAGAAMLGVVAAAWAEDRKAAKVEVTREKLAGTWVGKPPKVSGKVTLRVRFTESGKVTIEARTEEGDKESKSTGTYKIDGDKIKLTPRGKDEEKSLTVTKLTDTELVVKNPKGETITFKKAKAKGK
jgi:uncharacterized protein (TIGR03066 family)